MRVEDVCKRRGDRKSTKRARGLSKVCPRFVTRLQLECQNSSAWLGQKPPWLLELHREIYYTFPLDLIHLSCRQNVRMRGVKKVES